MGVTGAQIFGIGRDLDGVSPTTVISTGTLAANVWNHIGISFDCPTRLCTTYINGVDAGSGTFTNSTGANFSSTNSKNASIGSGNDGIDVFFDGDIEDARVYNRVLSANEFMSIASGKGKDGIVQGLQGRWHMREQGEGVTVTAVSDLSNSGIAGSPSATPPSYSTSSISSPRSRRPWGRR